MSDHSPQGWRTVAGLFLAVSVVESLAMGHLFSFLPLLLRDMRVPEAQIVGRVGVFTSLMFVLGLPLVPFWGVWADRYSRRAVIARSAYVEAVVFCGLFAVRDPFELGAAMLLVGLQLGNTGVMLSALRQVTPPERVGFALSLVQLGSPIGAAIGPAFGGWLMDRGAVTLRGLFLIDGILSLATGLVVMFVYRETRPSKIPEGSIVRQAFGAVGTAFLEPVARRLFAVMVLFLVARGMVNPLFALVVQRVHPDPVGLPGAIGLVAGTAATLGALASPLAGLAGDRVGHRTVLAAGVVMGAAALGGLGFARTVPQMAVLSALVSAASATVVSMIYALLALLLPEERRSGVLSLAFVPFYVGGMLGPNLAGLIARGNLDPVFPAAAAIALVALPLALSPALGGKR
jgi:DHA1 family multidrug resistance protein-like MFS transporter